MPSQSKIKVNRIKVGEHEQRQGDDPEQFAELVNSIGKVGLINPIVVARDGDDYILVAGHRRLEAVRKLGYAEVQCTLRESSKSVDAEITFAENFCRRQLTPIEQACAIKDCYENATMTVGQMAAAFHRSENWVAAQMDMVSWPVDVLEAIHAEKISVAAARNLAMVDDDNYREFLVRNAVDSGATARSTAAWLQAYRSMAPAAEAVAAEPVAAGMPAQPMVPQAPCLGCGMIHRTDELSHVPMCQTCIQAIRNADGR